MAETGQPDRNKAAKVLQDVGQLEDRVEELQSELASLQDTYRQAGNRIQAEVQDDAAAIKEVREEVERIAALLQGTQLFGLYARDADHHFRIANRWRFGAVAVLMAAPAVVAALISWADLEGWGLWGATSPVLFLFLYLSIESFNHRRREFDRRRIALRVSAIEAFTKARREGDDVAGRKTAEKLLDDFIRKHFIEPELDSNDISYLGPRFSFVTILGRGGAGASDAKAQPGTA